MVYAYAYTMVEGKTPPDMAAVLAETFTKTIPEARAVPASLVGPGYFAPMRADEFAGSRVVEAVVHGIDLAQALGSPYFATAGRIAMTAAILDDLLAPRTTGRRPTELSGLDPGGVRPGRVLRQQAAANRLTCCQGLTREPPICTRVHLCPGAVSTAPNRLICTRVRAVQRQAPGGPDHAR